MDDLWTAKRFAQWFYELGETEPSKSQINSINARCREGKLPAFKLCGSWRIDVSEIMKGVKR